MKVKAKLTKKQEIVVDVAKKFNCTITYDGVTDFAIIEVVADNEVVEKLTDEIYFELQTRGIEGLAIDSYSKHTEITVDVPYNDLMFLGH